MTESLPEPSVVVVDDHELFLAGLVRMLTARAVSVVGTALTGEAALEVVARTHPEVVLMDLALPGISGFETTRRLVSTHPNLCVIVLTALAHEADLVEAIMAGAAGYLLKDASIDEIVAGVHGVLRGESLVSPQLTRALLQRVRSRPAEVAPTPARLTEREHEVLKLIVDGCENAEIAERLYISQSTVKSHVRAILAKLGVNTRLQAAVHAVRSRMI
jgi:DNA-binding NarL/FixJ family response regulator